MNRLSIHLMVAVVLGAITLLWLAADASALFSADSLSLLRSLVQGSGLLALCAMVLALLFAARLEQLDRLAGGLDRAYQLHKWLAIFALVSALAHWGLLRYQALAFATADPLAYLLEAGARWHQLGSWAGKAGDVVFKLLVLVCAMALVKAVPYRLFRQSHRVLSVIYLVLACHGLVLMRPAYWAGPLGVLVALLVLFGAWLAIRALSGRVGRSVTRRGLVQRVSGSNGGQYLRVEVRCPTWPGHRAGQFAFVEFGDDREGHPFTIASAWRGDGVLEFVIKSLGDHTSVLGKRLQEGMPVRLEGPYGGFCFGNSEHNQIWVAGGIGITPFLARMEAMRHQPKPLDNISLYWASRDMAPELMERVTRLTQEKGIALHRFDGQGQRRLDFEVISQWHPQWQTAAIYLCGPSQLTRSLVGDAVSRGVARGRCHWERFEFR